MQQRPKVYDHFFFFFGGGVTVVAGIIRFQLVQKHSKANNNNNNHIESTKWLIFKQNSFTPEIELHINLTKLSMETEQITNYETIT